LLRGEDLALRVGVRDVPLPRPGEALVAVSWAGVPGCEIAGVVELCPGGEIPVGTLVVAGPGVSRASAAEYCGHCTVDVHRLVRCPGTLEPAIAVLAEPLALAVRALAEVPEEPGGVLLLGYGPLGALVHLEAQARWPRVSVEVVEPDAARRRFALALGADIGLPGRDRAWQLVVDTARHPGSLAYALAACADRGTVLVIGRDPDPAVPVHLTGLAERDLRLVGVTSADRELRSAVARLEQDPDRFRPVVTEALLLDEAPERLSRLAELPSVGKVVINPCPN
jgi:threonine dehydrogenase-like Zn-dependent dehydrogenase